jgi:hypothetical protein
VRITLQHGTRCADCGTRLPAGTEAEWYPPAAGVEGETTCVACPEQPQRPVMAPNASGGTWREGTCSGKPPHFFAARKATGGLPAACPECGAAWVDELPTDRQEPRDDDHPPLRLVAG